MAKKVPKSGDISVTVQMLNEFRDDLKYLFTSKFLELRADINGVEARLNGRMDRLDAGLTELKSDMNQVEARLNGRMDRVETGLAELKSDMNQVEARLNGRMDRVDAGFVEVKSDIHHVKLLCETQNQQSQIALDGARHAVEEVAALREHIDKMV